MHTVNCIWYNDCEGLAVGWVVMTGRTHMLRVYVWLTVQEYSVDGGMLLTLVDLEGRVYPRLRMYDDSLQSDSPYPLVLSVVDG